MSAPSEARTVYRILDANFNRARESIRILEDHVRFGLEDAHLAGRFKDMRHALCRTVAEAWPQRLASFRDTPGDVGRHVSTESEHQRSEAADVLAAAANRLSESLRTLEEYGKTISEAFGRTIEQLRYESYSLASQLLRRVRPCVSFEGLLGVYVLITEALCRRDWYETAAAALAGGARAIQLREKSLPDRTLLERAGRLRGLCDRHQALLIVNDRADVALAAGADGVHIGQDDLSVREVRRILGPRFLVGLSTHTVRQAQDALVDPPDYLAIGPMFASSTKRRPPVAGPQTLQHVREITSCPLVAIGGIDHTNAHGLEVADCLAVCRAVIAADDVESATRRLVELRATETISPTVSFSR